MATPEFNQDDEVLEMLPGPTHRQPEEFLLDLQELLDLGEDSHSDLEAKVTDFLQRSN